MSAPRQRDLRVDAIRGLCLVVMTVNHLPPNPFRLVLIQPFGLVNATEAFVFISGIVTAWTMGSLFRREGDAGVVRALFRRVTQLYAVHICLLALSLVLQGIGGEGRTVSLDQFAHLMARGAILRYQPWLIDVLPMYIVFLAAAPAALWLLRGGRSAAVLGASFAFWLIALYVPNLLGHQEFDLVSWQLVYVTGLTIGSWRVKTGKSFSVPGWAIPVLGSIAAVFFVLRHAHRLGIAALTSAHLDAVIWHRHTLYPLRLVNFAILATLIAAAPRAWDTLLRQTYLGRMLAFLGQHSLQVFCWSVVVAILAHHCHWERMNSIEMIGAAILVSATLLIPAWLHKLYRDRSTRSAVPPLPHPATV